METSAIATIFFAVLIASLAGSGHCVGMCGPFAILVAERSQRENGGRWQQVGLYHFGRLLTYAIIGVIAGTIGLAFDAGGQVLGWQKTAAWFAGLGMIAYGILMALRLFRIGSLHVSLPPGITKLIQSGYRRTSGWPDSLHAMGIGIITGWLPCGWLYAFVILAVGTSHPLTGAVVMLSFWLGTIPSLSLLVIGVKHLPSRWRLGMPYITATILIASGVFAVSMRAYADFSSLQPRVESPTTVEAIEDVTSRPKPCCHR